MKHYLITGGTGMIGTQLVNAIVESDAHITILT
ncbi:TIGR01777 family oxidoreductase, partial [Staphylococcus arlettae]